MATGRKMQHDLDIHGSKGAIFFSQERLNELHFYSLNDTIGRHGFRKIEAEPSHHPYGNFCVAPGHQIGFNDLKAIEIAGYLNAIMGIGPEPFSFRQGMRIQHLIEKYKNHQPLEGGCQFNNFLFSDAWRKDPQSPTKFAIKKYNLSSRTLRQPLHEQPTSFNLYHVYYF